MILNEDLFGLDPPPAPSSHCPVLFTLTLLAEQALLLITASSPAPRKGLLISLRLSERPPPFFVVCQGFLHFAQLLTSSYMKSSVSTIERRFGLTSQMSGFIVSFNEVGNTTLIIFVSYMGSRVHRPRLIGCGAILVSMSAFIISLPHFITEPYEYDRSVSVGSNLTDICLPNKLLQSDQCSAKRAKEVSVVLFLIFLGQLLMGIGAVPIQPFGISYIDDFASKHNSPLYLGKMLETLQVAFKKQTQLYFQGPLAPGMLL
ncbi:hypothetical protein lerEdw1_005781 [Lerista edwardsae]|nr:hypothetical protein lerEdw1_005781 [Lerista edwardsae]